MRAGKNIIIGAIKAYKAWVSPYIGNNCRYSPTCSQYMMDAVEKHGIFKGLFEGFKRVLRCNQLFKGGYDPVK